VLPGRAEVILKPENRVRRLAYCKERKDWLPEQGVGQRTRYRLILEELGCTYGVEGMRREVGTDWVGTVKKRCPTIMCWDMIDAIF